MSDFMGYTAKQIIIETRLSHGQKTNEEVINIHSHQGMKIKTPLRCHFTQAEWLRLKPLMKHYAGDDVE